MFSARVVADAFLDHINRYSGCMNRLYPASS